MLCRSVSFTMTANESAPAEGEGCFFVFFFFSVEAPPTGAWEAGSRVRFRDKDVVMIDLLNNTFQNIQRSLEAGGHMAPSWRSSTTYCSAHHTEDHI